ncbi:MAG TPA: hypothetical protein VI485_02570 [Vicinamibacterales bacterium]|nr:hypothetical protein [Vicinamibacterales bacterium]
MTRLLILTLGVSLAAGACGTTASDAADAPVTADNGATPAAAVVPARPAYREVTIPTGTSLPLALTSSVASDTSTVEDAVTAELTGPIRIDGRDVLPAGTRLTGVVTDVDDSGRVKGRAMVAFRFTSLRTGDTKYDLQSAPLSHQAAATKGEDATKIGIGAGAGAIIGGIVGGKKGAATGAAVGGGAGTGVVLATKGREVRLGPGADVTTQLTAPLTIRVGRS